MSESDSKGKRVGEVHQRPEGALLWSSYALSRNMTMFGENMKRSNDLEENGVEMFEELDTHALKHSNTYELIH